MALDDSKSERLWRQIEARKQADNCAPIPHDPARNGNAPGEIAFVDALFKTLQEDCPLPSPEDQAAARARLHHAISSERNPVPLSAPPSKPGPFRRFEWNRQSLLIALLLLLIVIGACFAAWTSWQRMCHTNNKAKKSTWISPSAPTALRNKIGGDDKSRILLNTADGKQKVLEVDGRSQGHCEQ